MRVVKLVLGAIIVIVLSLVIVQNPHVFWAKESLQLNLGVWRDQTPEIALALYFLTVFIVGFLGAYFISLADRFRTRKMISLQQQTIQKLEQEVQTLKSPPIPEQDTSPAENEDA